ncbi:MAG: tocopherol cyclase family protein [bacterium]|nr:tocopherol cyclase family protein [bacterium]
MKKYYYGTNKKNNYFEGWYFKHVFNGQTIIFIPGISYTNNTKEAFIQVIVNDKSTFIPFSLDQFHAKKEELFIQIGGNLFTKRGIKICIHKCGLDIDGVIRYGKLNTLRYSIMGPLELIPLLECSHQVISMDHAIYGSLTVNGEELEVNRGRGYIESDHGNSFPENYIWSQCNHFKQPFTSVMVAVADVLLRKILFQGTIAVVLYKGKEYRFATYLNAKVRECTKNKIILTQNTMILKVHLCKNKAVKLSAPKNGSMIRTIHENVNSKVHYYFEVNHHVLLDEVCELASYESIIHSKHYLP